MDVWPELVQRRRVAEVHVPVGVAVPVDKEDSRAISGTVDMPSLILRDCTCLDAAVVLGQNGNTLMIYM